MVRAVVCLVTWLAFSKLALGHEFLGYHSQENIQLSLRELASAYPHFVRFHSLGKSEQGRPIDYVVISNVEPEQVPAIYINGTHHGDEKASTESVLGLIDYLIQNRRVPAVRELLSNYAIYLQPIVNPDGHAANSRYDARGIDPNRDYSYPGRSDDESFKTPAVRLIKELTRKIKFRAALAFHSGMEGVLWAWAHSAETSNDYDTYYTLAKLTANAMGINRYQQSYWDYPTQGEFIDYVYMAHGTLAMTVEVANTPTPPPNELSAIVKRAIAGSVAFMLAIMDLDHGVLRIAHNSGRH